MSGRRVADDGGGRVSTRGRATTHAHLFIGATVSTRTTATTWSCLYQRRPLVLTHTHAHTHTQSLPRRRVIFRTIFASARDTRTDVYPLATETWQRHITHQPSTGVHFLHFFFFSLITYPLYYDDKRQKGVEKKNSKENLIAKNIKQRKKKKYCLTLYYRSRREVIAKAEA